MEEDSTTDMDVSYEETTHHNGSSETQKKLTGKRVRKKNPKYVDDDEEEPKKKTAKRGRKKGTRTKTAKKPKLTHEDTPTEVVQMRTLHDQKRELEYKLMELKQDLQKINQKLFEKPVNGLTAEDKIASVSSEITATMEQLSGLASKDTSTSTDDLGFDEPTDDEDEAYTKPPVHTPPPPPPAPVKPKKAPVKKTTPKRKPAAKAKSTPKQTESIATSRPQRVRRSTVKDLAEADPIEPTLSPTMESCRKVLKSLMSHRYAFPFNVPVDPVALKIPDYFQIITNPMDFGTILQKVNTEQYDDMEEFCSDMELVFGNACTYNRPTSDVYIMAETLQNLYKKKIKAVEDKEKESKGEVVNESSLSQGAICELKKTVDVMRQELSLLREQQGVAPPKNRRPAARSKQRPEEPLPMTKEEKKKLSMGINSLSGTNLAMVVKIIKEKMPNIANAQEIVIDIETLDSATLRSLESYVNKVKRKKSKRRPSKRKPGQPGTTSLNPEEIASKLEMAKQTEIGTQSRILDVQRQLQEIQSKSAALTRSGTFPTPATPTGTSVPAPTSPAPTTPTAGGVPSANAPKKAETSESSESGESASDSESSSSESESSSDDSESGDENGKTTKTSTSSQPFQVETVIAPVFTNIAFNKLSTPPVARRAEETPHIIPAVAPTEVKVDNLKNADSWSLLAEEDNKKTEATVESADVKNLWSSFVDNHALLKKKELEKQQREEELRRKREEQEERKRQELIQKQKEEEEARIRREREIEEAKLLEERKIEEARLQAQRQLESNSKQLQEVEPVTDDIFSMSNYSSSISGVKMPDHMLNLLKKSGTNLSNNPQ